MKKDIYNHKERFLNWKEKVLVEGISELPKPISDIVVRYVLDMELGLNVSPSSKKGSRSFPRLNNIKQRLIFILKELSVRYQIENVDQLEEQQVFEFFNNMRNGTIRTIKGEIYKSTGDYVRVMKSFWNWYIRSSRKEGREIKCITNDLSNKGEKPKWVYLNEEQIRTLTENVKFEYRVLITFLIDSGVRSPSELVNIKVSDFYKEFKELNIRDEISKTFGRRINLLLSPSLLKEYVKKTKKQPNDYMFPISYVYVNRYLKIISKKLFGEEESKGREKFSNLSLYDFRHISCCFWLPRYKNEISLKYRFGWKNSDKIHYYSEMLGMRDSVTQEDLLIDVTKTELEKRLVKTENENEILKERLKVLEEQMEKIGIITNKIYERTLL